MILEFLRSNRTELISRCRAKVARRRSAPTESGELRYGIDVFLDQFINALKVEQASHHILCNEVAGPGIETRALIEIRETAAQHGQELLQHGFAIDQAVHDYGDLGHAIADLALEERVPIEVEEFRTLNSCLDNAIGVAVTEFSSRRDFLEAEKQTVVANTRLGSLAHEMRNLLGSATLALSAIKAGTVGLTGATGSVLDRSLVGLRNLIDRSLSEVRLTAGQLQNSRLFSLAEFILEVKLAAALEAQVRGRSFIVSHVDSELAVDADRDLLFSAVGNLLQNAFKFTRPDTEVILHVYAVADRILIEVEDNCGGLPPGSAEKMFAPFTQNSEDKSGLGLGLSIARRSIEANGGTLSVRDKPRTGCIFTIDLPRHLMPKPAGT